MARELLGRQTVEQLLQRERVPIAELDQRVGDGCDEGVTGTLPQQRRGGGGRQRSER